MYQKLNDPRRQLRFIEDLERKSFNRRKNLENEEMAKSSKTKEKGPEKTQKAKGVEF
jgi:hypothetical protein